MPLQKGKIDYLFQSGMAGDTDPRIVPVGAFLDIKNAYVDKKGALVKRNGFQRIAMDLFDGSSVDASRGLFSAGDELCLSGSRKLYALDDVSGEWNDRGPISPMVGKTDQFFSEDVTIFRSGLDSSTNDGYRLMATGSIGPAPGLGAGPSKSYVWSVETRIDSDDGNVARESEVLFSAPVSEADFVTFVPSNLKASFCQDSLLLCVGSSVYRFDTTNLSAPPTIIRSIPTVDQIVGTYRRRLDMCGHTGAVAAGEFSLKFVTNNFDLAIWRMDNNGFVVDNQLVPGPAAGRWILDASISDDPVNDRTLAIVVYVDSDPREHEGGVAAMNLRIGLCSIDHSAGLLWFQIVDTINVSEDFGYRISQGPQVNPEAMGVSRGQLKDGTEIVAGVYSIARDAGHPGIPAAATHSVGFGTDTWQSTNYLWDADNFQTPGITPPANFNPQGDWGHVNYPRSATGAGDIGGVTYVPRRVPTKWVRTVVVSVDAATGGTGGGVGRARDIYNCCLDSKPFYNGRSIYAWCSSNLNIAAGYETAFCLDFRQDNSLASLIPEVPPYLVAVKDVGVCQPPQGEYAPSDVGDRYRKFVPRGAGQSADRDSLGRVLTSSVIVKEALSFRHGELLRDPGSGWPDERTAATVTTLSFGDPVSVATLADGASVVGGAMVSWYDTQRCTELSYIAPPVFDHFWSQVNQSTDMTIGVTPWPIGQTASRLPIDMDPVPGPIPSVDHLYTYIAIWKTYDSKGYLHRSIFSPSYQAPPINATCVTWPQNTPYWSNIVGPVTRRLDCNVMFTKTCVVTNRLAEEKTMTTEAKIYRDFSNNQIFQEVNGKTDVTLNASAKWWTHFVDYGQDLTTLDPNIGDDFLYSRFTSPGGEVLYTVGGELESVIPSGAKLAVYANDRIWLAGFYHAERLAYSKKVTPQGANLQKIAPEFNEGFVLTTPAGAAITSLASMDDKVVAFTKSSVYVVAGDGPTATGANNTFSALTLVSSDSGCAEPRSTVTFPGGVMYQGDGGIYVLTRGMTTSFIGEGIRDITNQYPVITSAVSVPSKTQVRFTATTADGTSGVIIIFDYRVNQWMYWSVGGAPFVGAALHRGIYFTVEETGQVWREDVSTWKDGADDTYYQMNVKTAWLQAAKQSGWQRVYRATALCENKAPMNMRMTVANDFNATTSQVALWDDAVIATFPEPPRMQPMIHVKRQQCQAVQLEIMDEEPSAPTITSGEGFTIAGFSLEVGLKRGMVKVSKQQRS